MDFLVYRSSAPQGTRVFVRASEIVAVEGTPDGGCRLTLMGGAQLSVIEPDAAVVKLISAPPKPPVLLAQMNSPTDQTPLITGKAEPGSQVVVSDSQIVVASTKTDVLGDFSVATSPLSYGEHYLTAKQTDLVGNVSEPSQTITLAIQEPPPPPEPVVTEPEPPVEPVPEPVPEPTPAPTPAPTPVPPVTEPEPFEPPVVTEPEPTPIPPTTEPAPEPVVEPATPETKPA